MKRKIFFLFIIVVSLLVCGCNRELGETYKDDIEVSINASEEGFKPGENIPITRAMAAKTLSLAFCSAYEIETLDNEISFQDVNEGDWFYSYVNCVYRLGYMSGTGEEFLPDTPLNINEMKIILDKISDKEISVSKNNENKEVSYSLWISLLYEVLEDRFNDLNLEVEDVNVFATTEKGSMPSWQIATDKGVLNCSGYSTDIYIDKKIKIMLKDNEIIGVFSVEDSVIELSNVYIEKIDSNKINVFFEGGNRVFQYSDQVRSSIANVKIKDSLIISLDFLETKFTDVIKATDLSKISFQNAGVLPVNESFKVYSKVGNISSKNISALICGSDVAKIYIENNEICAAVIDEDIPLTFLRVLISTSNFEGYIHDLVSLEGSTFKVTSEKNEYIVTNLDLPKDDFYFKDVNRIYIEPIKDTSICISSIERNWQNSSPFYSGKIEIEKRDEGYIIINEIELEKYLEAVLPSEMPSSYGLEAAKVQAICARSYAYNQFYTNKYYEYGANIDDSVLSQVYNNIPANSISIEAVKATRGKYLSYNNEIISANFFSTSAGVFANSGDVWAKGNVFPAESKEYLSASNETNFDVSKENEMRKFLESDNTGGYDTWSEWNRWSVSMNAEELQKTIEENIGTAYAFNSNLVKTLQADGTFKSRDIILPGRIKNIQVLKRGEGGNIIELKVEGENSTILLRTEYIIRTTIRPVSYSGKNIYTILKNGHKVNNYSIMPSAFFVFDMMLGEEEYIDEIVFIGGGNGHGVGMSQNGVKGMIDAGKSYEEVLAYYYSGTRIISV